MIYRIESGSADDGFVTRGDNMPLADPWRVLPRDIVGRQVLAVPNAASVLLFVRSPIVLASFLAGLATYLTLGWLGRAAADERSRATDSPPVTGMATGTLIERRGAPSLH